MNAENRIAEPYEWVPWNCGDSDCPTGWHLATYWTGNETTVDNYSDGDHEPIDFDDIPGTKEIERLWVRYYRSVAYLGKDPLGVFSCEIEAIETRSEKAIAKDLRAAANRQLRKEGWV